MKTIRMYLWGFILMLALMANAQDVTNTLAITDTNIPAITQPSDLDADPVESASGTVNALIMIAITIVAPMIVRLGKVAFPFIPARALPLIAPVLLVLGNWISDLAGGPSVNPVLAALLGAAGTGVRELKESFVNSSPSSKTVTTLLLLGIGIGMTGIACTITKIDPVTGQPVKVYDPVKTQQVKDAVLPITASTVRRVLENNPTKAVEIASYFRAIGTPFCSIAATGLVDLNLLTNVLDAATASRIGKLDPVAIELKNTLLALFKVFYADRFKAELPPEAWTRNIADVICSALDQGLKDAGLTGIK